LTYNLDSQQASSGCQGTCSYKISSSEVQQFTSYCVHSKNWRRC